MKYVVIIPAKNEELCLAQTLDNLLHQTIRPQCILIVDNDSTDNTPNIVKNYSSINDNIKLYEFKNGNDYSLGGKIVKIFHAGKTYLDNLKVDYDYIIKMDADTRFDNKIFEELSNKITGQSLGIFSPIAFTHQNNHRVYASSPEWHTLGDFKIYNRQCLEKMGGLPEDLGWDCADNIRAMEIGYATQVFRDIGYEQTRPIGRYSLLKGWKRQGIGAWKLRYNPLYLFIKSLHDILKPPLFIGSLFYLFGYFTAMLGRYPRVLTKKQGKILRKLFWKSLLDRFRKGRFYIFQIVKRNN
ncbi:MAG: glycosyltransferase [Cyclobacteriaceae bacterium]